MIDVRRTFFLLCLFLAYASVSLGQGRDRAFQPGELATYKLQLGFITVGEAEVSVSDKLYECNGKPCYNMEVHGRTTGVFGWTAKVNDYWGAYVDTVDLDAQRFYLRLREMSYRKRQVIRFDRETDSVYVEKRDKRSGEYKYERSYSVPSNVQDIVGGFYGLRSLDFDTMDIGDVFVVPGFFDDSVYNLNVRLLERTVLKTKLGKKDALLLQPFMPKNELFDKGESIKVWLSNDEYKIPLKIRAKMFVGSVDVDIRTFRPGTVSLKGQIPEVVNPPENRRLLKKENGS